MCFSCVGACLIICLFFPTITRAIDSGRFMLSSVWGLSAPVHSVLLCQDAFCHAIRNNNLRDEVLRQEDFAGDRSGEDGKELILKTTILLGSEC